MRPDLLLWLTGGVAALAGGVLSLWEARQQGIRGRKTPLSPALLTCLGLAAVAAGLGWRGWQRGSWPGGVAAEALAWLAFGALLATLWQPGEKNAFVIAFSLLGTGLLLCGVVASGMAAVLPAAQLPARGWLFGLRSLLVGLGTGGWLPVLAASLLELGAERQGRAAPDMSWPGRSALRFCYPWLTTACLAAGIWNLATHAIPWRTVPADLWLAVTWLLGAVYLHAIWDRQTPRLPSGLLSTVALAGLAAALLAAWQVTTLF